MRVIGCVLILSASTSVFGCASSGSFTADITPPGGAKVPVSGTIQCTYGTAASRLAVKGTLKGGPCREIDFGVDVSGGGEFNLAQSHGEAHCSGSDGRDYKTYPPGYTGTVILVRFQLKGAPMLGVPAASTEIAGSFGMGLTSADPALDATAAMSGLMTIDDGQFDCGDNVAGI